MTESPSQPNGPDASRDAQQEDAFGGGETVQVACFFVGSEEYAIDIMRIKEIINPVAITPVPRAPGFIEGIIELRGAFLPVVDLRKRFDLPASAATRESKYIIVAIARRIIGLVVDRVVEVRRVATEQISKAPDMAVDLEARFFNGVVKWDERIVMMLDLDEVLSRAEKEQLRGMERG